jgi:hypothetical protein
MTKGRCQSGSTLWSEVSHWITVKTRPLTKMESPVAGHPGGLFEAI